MKTLHIILLGLLAMTFAGRAQDIVITNAGWFTVEGLAELAITNETSSEVQTNEEELTVTSFAGATPPVIAETITPEIQALADGLQRDPVQIFNYVHDHIRHVLHFGSKKGAELTLLEKSGNDFDQSALLVALLRAAGYTDASYQFGWVQMPYDNPDGSHRDLHHWLGLSLVNTDWPTTADYLDYLFKTQRFYPITASNLGNNTFAFQRVWVKLPIGGTNYLLDPAFKVSEPIVGINLPAATGFDSNNLMTAAAGTSNTNYVSDLSETGISGKLKSYTTNLLNYIQSNYPNASVEEIVGGQRIVPATNTALSQSLLFPGISLNGMTVVDWINEPTNLMSAITVSFAGTSYRRFIPQLNGQRLSLTIDAAGLAQLWQDDTLSAQANTGGGTGKFSLTWDVYHPSFMSGWDVANNVLIPGNHHIAVPADYQSANANYALMYAFEPDWGWLRQRQKILEDYKRQGRADTSREVTTETLNIMGMNWTLQFEYESRLLAAQTEVLPQFHHRMGRMGQEAGKGYYVDVYMATTGAASGLSRNDGRFMKWFDLSGYFGSAMEHGVIEQLQATGLTGLSTVKILETANAPSQNFLQHQPIYLVNSANWAAVSNTLYSSLYFTSSYDSVISDINAGYTILVASYGGIFNPPATNAPFNRNFFQASVRRNGNGIKMLIGSGYGGYVSSPSAVVNPVFVNQYSYVQPQFFSSVPAFVANPTGADPVSMGDGTFQVADTDLTLGGTEPRGLSFSRYYSSTRRNSNLAGLGHGWLHNYYLNATKTSAPEAALGGTTPAQAAAMLAANCAALNLYDSQHPSPKNWMVTALIAKWGLDQITDKAVSVTLGKDTVQFVLQPNGTYTPPANCTMNLTATTSTNYILHERHGRTFTFNSLGWVSSIADQYGKALTLAYNASTNVSTVTDWKGRTLTFTYAGNPSRLASVTDGSRTIALGYSTGGDLVSVTDPESKTSRFLYDTSHQITATFDALNQLVASNIYNVFGRVTTQFTQGTTNKTWKIFWSGWQTVSQDPVGGKQSYFYDDKTRLIGQQDALGNVSRSFYDGQDHVTAAVSPLNETNQFIFDGNHNVVQVIDPLGFSNQFIYDSQNNLTKALDPLGNPTTFGYNSKFQMTGQTNGAGDWISFAFDATDGLLTTRTDAGGVTTYGYDTTYRQLNSVTYPSGLGSESFAKNLFGDATSHTDARGFSTAYQYNQRRQLTNTVTTDSFTVKTAYDAVGNPIQTTDARGVSYNSAWSATRHLLKTTLPATPAGAAVITNIYDSRDLLVKTLDPYQQPVLYTNDLAGRLVSQTDPLQRTVAFGYNANGNGISATNAAQVVMRQTWDARGKPIQTIDGAQHSSFTAYNAAGNQTALTNRNGKTWRFQFDAANRLTNTLTPVGRSLAAAYNNRGLLAWARQPSGRVTTYGYDGRGRLTGRNDNAGFTTYDYNLNGSLANLTDSGPANHWMYDAHDRVTNYSDLMAEIGYRYDANGNLTNLIFSSGKVVTYRYNSLNQLTNVTDWSGRKTVMAYDLNGRMTSLVRPNGTYRTVDYDAAGQATNILEQMANTLPIAWFKFNWTNTGNLGWEFAAPLPHPATVPTRTMTYDDDNRLLTVNGSSVAHDADGNLTYAPLTNDTLATYSYDARNRLLTAGGVTNYYDGLDQRLFQYRGTNMTSYRVDPNARLPQVLLRARGGVITYYIYGAGLLYQITETATYTNTRSYHFDYRGSTVAMSDDNGNVTDRFEYSAYGLMTYKKSITDTPFLFNGRYGVQTDANGLLYMKARYYNPYLCRFVSADPTGFGGGLNEYAYANGNPVSLIDPFGLGAIGDAQFSSWLQSDSQRQNVSGLDLQGGILGVLDNVSDIPFGVATGTANDIVASVWGEDSSGNKISGFGRGVATASVFFTFVPVGGAVRAAKSGVSAYDVGSFGALKARSLAGDALDIHHVGQTHPFEQLIPGYNRATAPAIALPEAEHRLIPRFSGTTTMAPRDILANDIRNLRNLTMSPNSSLQQLINLNKQMYPYTFIK